MATRSDAPAPSPRWSQYGFLGNPFFTDPLEPDENALYPITLFRGREDARERLLEVITGDDRSASVIVADGGHGKTTLASWMAHKLEDGGFLVLPDELQVSPEDPTLRFFRDLLAGTLRALSEGGVELPDAPASGEPPTDEPLAEARHLVQTLRRTSFSGIGLTLGGTGGSVQRQTTFLQPIYEPGPSRNLLRRVAREVASLGFRGMLVRVNNLDVIARLPEDSLPAFLHEIRDLLQVPGIHYLLMGDDTVAARIEGAPRLRGCFALPVRLDPFAGPEVLEIITARYRHLAKDPEKYVPPVADEVIRRLHDIHYGDLRNVLSDLGRVLQLVRLEEARPADMMDAFLAILQIYGDSMASNLTEEQWETLIELARRGEPTRQTDLVEALGITASAVNQRFKPLEETGAIELDRKEGVSKYYRLTSHGRLGILAALPSRWRDGIEPSEFSVFSDLAALMGFVVDRHEGDADWFEIRRDGEPKVELVWHAR